MSQITSIESFKFKLEGFGTPIFEVYYQKYFVFYSACKYIYGKGIQHNKEITIDALEMFKSKLNELSLINWENVYSECHVIDGETWEIEIFFNASGEKKIIGYNCYPGCLSNICERTEPFNELLEAIKVLIIEPAFFSDDFFE